MRLPWSPSRSQVVMPDGQSVVKKLIVGRAAGQIHLPAQDPRSRRAMARLISVHDPRAGRARSPSPKIAEPYLAYLASRVRPKVVIRFRARVRKPKSPRAESSEPPSPEGPPVRFASQLRAPGHRGRWPDSPRRAALESDRGRCAESENRGDPFTPVVVRSECRVIGQTHPAVMAVCLFNPRTE